MTLEEFTPSEIVTELDKYIVGQKQAKEAVAIALRNRIRRKKLPKALMEEITPKNIIMIGPTGVGKTEIARRLAKLVQAPFIKVEATKFTEVGYVGKDVDSMIRDLTQAAVQLVRKEKIGEVREKAKERVEERILQALLPIRQQDINEREEMVPKNDEIPTPQSVNSRNRENNIIKTENRVGNRDSQKERFFKTKERLRTKLKNGELEEREINIEIEEQGHTSIDIFSNIGMEGIGVDFKEFLDKMMPGRKKRRKIKISEAKKILLDDELEKLLDMNEIAKEAVYRTEELGIVFIDEIDKIAMKEKSYGPDVSRGGVQRDILPIIEGSTVMTKYGAVKTDYILFIAAGAFNASKPSDLIPELQGRFPLRVELNSLHQEDLEKILVEPDNSLIKQYKALLKTESIELDFDGDAVKEIAKIAALLNEQNENIGARRLYTVMEKLLDRISFNAPKMTGKNILISKKYVTNRLQNIIKEEDLSKYIL